MQKKHYNRHHGNSENHKDILKKKVPPNWNLKETDEFIDI